MVEQLHARMVGNYSVASYFANRYMLMAGSFQRSRYQSLMPLDPGASPVAPAHETSEKTPSLVYSIPCVC